MPFAQFRLMTTMPLDPGPDATTQPVSSGQNGMVSLHLHKVRVEIVQGPDTGATIEIGGKSVTLGRSAACDLVLTDPTVSALHAELSLEPSGVLVRNLESRNGIHAGGARLQEGLVDVGTPILMGRTVVRLYPLEEKAEIPFAAVRRTGDLVSESLKMKMVFGQLRQYATVDSPVLIEGETGTGKELAARAVHDLSARASGPYEILDCGAIPNDLIEAELFGVARGAYTDAVASRPGAFERANGGTVVLDEIGELPIALQPALLGVLERGQVRRLGETITRKVSVRIIATTNRLLAREIQANRFRQDLYFRLSVLRLNIPPLRQRKEDIPLLVEHFLGADHGFPPAWMNVLRDHDWPGNVRELRNVLARAVAHARRHGKNVPLELLLGETEPVPNLETARRKFEREYLQSLLAKVGGNVARASRLAGLTRQGLYRLLRRNGIGPKRITAEVPAVEAPESLHAREK